MNHVIWNSNALNVVKSFPEEVKKSLGYLIYKLQLGKMLSAPHSKSMSSINKGCYELRVKDGDGVYRAFYYLKVEGKILIFHAFQKKTQKTPRKEIELGRRNLKEMFNGNAVKKSH